MVITLRVILFLTGCVIIWLGLNTGLGGIETLGWQGATNFFSVTDPDIFAVQDNHMRFIAGVWMAVGILMIVSAFALRAMRKVLFALVAMVFVGGLMRFSAGDPALLSSPSVAPSLIAEFNLLPLLVVWICFATKEQARA